MCEFLQNIKNIHSILKGITTKKRKGRGGGKKKKETQDKKKHQKYCLHSHHWIFVHACISDLNIALVMVLYV